MKRTAALVNVLADQQQLRHDAFMSISVTIRNVPNEARDVLAARAALTGRSLQDYLRAQLIELARKPDPEAWLEEVRRRKAATGSRLDTDAILRARDADRR